MYPEFFGHLYVKVHMERVWIDRCSSVEDLSPQALSVAS